MDATLQGFEALDKKLAMLGDSMSRRIVGTALRKSALPILRTARANLKSVLSKRVTREKGRAPGNLIESLKTSKGRVIRKYSRGETIVVIGPGWPLGQHGHLLEFGKFNQPPRPYLRPAFDTEKRNAMNVMRSTIAEKLEQEARKK